MGLGFPPRLRCSGTPEPRRYTLGLSRLLNRVSGGSMKADYMSRDPEIMSGFLCFKGTRVPVQNLFNYLEGSSSLEEFLEDFSFVSRKAVVAVLEAAKARLFADASVA